MWGFNYARAPLDERLGWPAGASALFVAGAVLPVMMMPEGVVAGLRWLFPYWTLAAPAELFLGRQGHADFGRGVLTLAVSASCAARCGVRASGATPGAGCERGVCDPPAGLR